MIIPWNKIILLTCSIFLILLLTFFAEGFRSVQSMHFFFQEISIVVLLAIGLSFLCLSGSFDLSLGGFFLLGLSLVRLWRRSDWSIDSHWSEQILAGFLIVILMSAIGLLLAWLTAIKKSQTLVVQLGFAVTAASLGALAIPEFGPWCQPWYCAEIILPASWLIWASIPFGLVVTLGTIIYFYPDFDWIKPITATWIMIGLGAFVVLEYQGLPLVVAVSVVVLMLGEIFLNHSLMGLRIRALGMNEEAARLSGVSLWKTRSSAFMIFGACIGLASLFEFEPVSRENLSPVFFRQWDVIVAVVLGGTMFAREQQNRRGALGSVALAGLFVVSLNQLEWLSFSLIELALIKALLVLAAVLVFPRLKQWLKKNKALPMRWNPD
jgi:D-xylose transport system permease protein